MLAGVGGIDLAMLVIAADEGVMPQTRRTSRYLLSPPYSNRPGRPDEIDMVETDWVELVRDDVATLVRGTFLEGAPVVPVSAKTGAGSTSCARRCGGSPRRCRARHRPAAAAAHRSRVHDQGLRHRRHGHAGRGRARRGRPRRGLSRGLVAKIRGSRRTGTPSSARWRAAHRGESPGPRARGRRPRRRHRIAGTLSATALVDVVLEILHDAAAPAQEPRPRPPARGNERDHGARPASRRRELAPGKRGFARLRLEAPLVALAGDRFVIRSYSPIVTIGGGTLLDTDRRGSSARRGSRT